jgi:lysophospholipid acyltransferase (LPLAT)-like uncharacterized protein
MGSRKMLAMVAETAASRDGAVAHGRFTLRQRILLSLISWSAYLLIRVIGPTLRYQVTAEDNVADKVFPHPGIFVFWHNAVIPAAYFYRHRNIAVMTSSSFDGEYIARIIEHFGFHAVRGSSTRGAVRALLGMHTEMERGRSVAFTIDGPRGPRYVAKPGPVLLARNVQVPIYPFYVAVERAWVLNSWDQLRIPKPFSRAQVVVADPIYVPPDSAGADELQQKMQASLERARRRAEELVKSRG